MDYYPNYYNYTIWGRYLPQDTIRYILWNPRGSIDYDYTEDTRWTCFYYPRHYPYSNIPTDDKINDFEFTHPVYSSSSMWALSPRCKKPI